MAPGLTSAALIAVLLPLAACAPEGSESPSTEVSSGSATTSSPSGTATPSGSDGNGSDGATTGTRPGRPGPDSESPEPSGPGPTADNVILIGAAFSAAPYSFGQTPPGTTVTRALGVRATVGTEATITAVSVDGAAFDIVEDRCTGVSFPGPPCTVTVAATPPREGTFFGSLVVRGGGSAALTVAGGTGPVTSDSDGGEPSADEDESPATSPG